MVVSENLNQIVPYDNDNPYRRPTLGEAIAFWGYMYKRGMLSIILYFLSFVMLLLVFWWLAQGLLSKYFVDDPWLILVLVLVLLPMFFFHIPSMPRLYEFQFKGKIRQDIPEAELKGLLIELTRKSLELAAMVIIVICVLCILVYSAARYLAISDIITLALEVATVFNTFLMSLVAVSLGGYNKDLLRKTFTAEEYKRYTSLGNYRRTFVLLAIFDALIGIMILYSVSGNLTIELAILLLIAVIVNVILAIGLWNYLTMKSEGESERKALLPQIKLSLAMLVMVDVIFMASIIIQKFWIGVSYEKTVFVLFTIFILATGILWSLWFILTSARRLLKSRYS